MKTFACILLVAILVGGCGKRDGAAEHMTGPDAGTQSRGVDKPLDTEGLCKTPKSEAWGSALAACDLRKLTQAQSEWVFAKLQAWSSLNGYWPQGLLTAQSFQARYPEISREKWDCVSQKLCSSEG